MIKAYIFSYNVYYVLYDLLLTPGNLGGLSHVKYFSLNLRLPAKSVVLEICAFTLFCSLFSLEVIILCCFENIPCTFLKMHLVELWWVLQCSDSQNWLITQITWEALKKIQIPGPDPRIELKYLATRLRNPFFLRWVWSFVSFGKTRSGSFSSCCHHHQSPIFADGIFCI